MDKVTLEHIIEYAIKAPSSHNAQPWQFRVKGDVIDLCPDFSRCLPVVDPNRRELYISLGAALENFIIAARAFGYECNVKLFPRGDSRIRITMRYRGGVTSQRDKAQLAAMKKRQSNRRPFTTKQITPGVLAQLRNVQPEHGTNMEIVDGGGGKESILRIVKDADIAQLSNKHYVAELLRSCRMNAREAYATHDGLWSRALGMPPLPSGRVGRLIARPLLTPGAQYVRDRALLQSSSHFLIFSVDGRNRTSWVLAGRYFERVALRSTELGLSMSHFNQIFEVPGFVARLRREVKLAGVHPVLMVRIGYAPPMPRSLRRPVKDVVTYVR